MKLHTLHAAASAVVLSLSISVQAQPTAPVGPARTPAATTPTAAGPAPSPAATAGASESGKIAWYGKKFAGRRTASGEVFNPDALTMAHKTLPFGTLVKVTNPRNGKSVTLRVNDRGPTQADRIADVSLAAAQKLGMVRSGVIEAQLEIVGTAPARIKKTPQK